MVSLINTTASLAEDTDTNAAVKVADIVVTDDALGTNDLSLAGADAALFEIVGLELFLKAGTVLDFETNPSLDVTIEVDDAAVGGTPDDTAPLSIDITDVNEPPVVSLINTTASLAEDTDTNAALKVADIVVTDDGLGTNDLSLAGADAALFEIVGLELFLKAGTVLDFETKPSLDVTIEVDDAAVGTTPDDTVLLSIAVTDVVEGGGGKVVIIDFDDLANLEPCLSGLHPHPLGLEWAQTGYRGARHGCSRPRRSPIPAFATRVPATFPR